MKTSARLLAALGIFLVFFLVQFPSNAQCTADFFVPTPNCTGQGVQFWDASFIWQPAPPGAIVTQWTWNFGDGTPNLVITYPSSPNVVHTFPVGGLSYSVTLSIVTSNACNTQVIKPVLLTPSPVVNFSFTSGNCSGVPVNFTDLSQTNGGGSIVAWNWDFGDPASGTSNQSTLQNPSHAFTAAGTFTVSLTVTNNNGCQASIIKMVTVGPGPNAAFTFPATGNCSGMAVSFTDMSSTPSGTITQWVWNFGDGTPPVTIVFPGNPNVVHVFAGSASSYNVTLSVTNSGGCTGQVVHTVSINANPIANFSFPASGNCAGTAVQFTDLTQVNGGGAITSWNWNFGDAGSGTSNTSTLQNPVHIFTTAGTYYVTLVATNTGGCQNTTTKPVTIGAVPIPGLSGPSQVCQGSAGNVYTTETGMTDYMWSLSSGGQITGGGTGYNSVTITWNQAGSQNVSVYYTSPQGCTALSPTIEPVMVNTIPQAVITPGGPTTFCEGLSVVLNASPAGSYLWNNGYTTQSIIVASAGSYTVTCTTSGCSATSAPVSVTTLPLPETPWNPSGPDTVNLYTGNTTIFSTGGAPSSSSFEWQLTPAEAGTISGTGITGSVAWNNNYLGIATVQTRSANSCGYSAWTGKEVIVVNDPLGIGKTDLMQGVKVFPNPAGDLLHVKANGVATLYLIDSRGISLMSAEIREEGTLNLRSLPAGFYTLRVSQTNKPPAHLQVIHL